MSPLRSSLARSVGKLLGVFKDTDLSLRGDTSGTRYVPPPFRAIAATGGTTFTNGGYKYHVYTTTGSPQPFNVTDAGSSTNIEYLIIAGGGGGADRGNGAGGGGAGGVLGYGMELPSTAHQGGLVTVTVQDYALVVGAGGQGAPENSGGEGSGDNGSPSTAFGKTAVGGGGGGQNNVTPGAGGDGGSGGGGDDTKDAGAGQNYPGPTQQGFPGGEIGGGTGGGGGGGASGAGQAGNASPNPGGGGIGIGFSWCPSSYGDSGPDGSKRYFAGGGQGGESSPGSGGYGGGGDFNNSGQASTGGGAGSGNDSGSGGTGGSGIIFVRYAV